MRTRDDFERFLADVRPELRPICRQLRVFVAELHPDLVVPIWPKQRIASYGVGPKKMSEHYVYIAPQTRHVNLGLYHGVAASDPTGLLEGTGKRLRHVKISGLPAAKAAPVRELISAAIAERQRAVD